MNMILLELYTFIITNKIAYNSNMLFDSLFFTARINSNNNTPRKFTDHCQI